MGRRQSRIPLKVSEVLTSLRHTRGLQDFSDDELGSLAGALSLVCYSAGTTFFRDYEGYLEAPLRVLVQGQLFWTAIADPDTAGAPTLDAGAIFGLASLNAWIRNHPRWSQLAVTEHPGFVAEAHSDLWVLELAHADYDRAFAGPQRERVVQRLIGLYGGRAYANKVVRALHQTPEFSRACPMHVSRVVEAGVFERWSVGDAIHVNGTKAGMALRYVVAGQVRVTDEDTGSSTVLGASELIPHRNLFSSAETPRTLVAVGDRPAHVIRIRRASLDFTIRTTPGFARTLGPATLDCWLDAPTGGDPSYPIIAGGEMTMVLADAKAGSLPLPQMVDLLGVAAREHLDDRVAVVRLLPERLGHASSESAYGVPETLIVPQGQPLGAAVRACLVTLAEHWGLLFDHILIDPSALVGGDVDRRELMRAMVDLPCPSQISYLVASPKDWAELPDRVGLISGVSVLPTALLGPKPARIELSRRLEALGVKPAARTSASSSRKLPRSRARQGMHVLGQLFDIPWSYPRPWPLDAARMRLGTDLLDALERVDTLIDFQQLELGGAQLEHARECFYRWARAVTWRRVGIGIGGAGSQSYVAIPFIRRLRAAGIPIDVMSGSSTGAFISAFYSALGDRGLDLMISKRHHFGFAVAAAWYHNAPFELLLTYLLEGLDLNDLEIPVIAVAARAADGETTYLSSSLAGQACMASGSLPPMVPTYVRNRRLLDGGLTLDVPTAVLTSAGAELILGVQPIPRVNPRPLVDQRVFVPPGMRLFAVLNPMQRLLDAYRAYLMLFRQAARGDEPNADVVYEATTQATHAALFAYGARVASDAADSPALEHALEQAVAEWQRMLTRPPGRVTFIPESGQFELGSSTMIALEARRGEEADEMSAHARSIVNQVALFIARHSEIDLCVVLHVPEQEPEESVERCEVMIDAALRAEGECERCIEYEVMRDASLRRIYFEFASSLR